MKSGIAGGWLGVFLLALASPAWAAFETTFVLSHTPGEAELARLAKVPGPKAYRVTVSTPSAADLARLVRLPEATRIELRFTEPPRQALLPEFQALAKQVPQAMFLFQDQPLVSEIRRIREAGFARLWISVQQYPISQGDLDAYALLGPESWVVFNTGRFPKADGEQGVLLEFPKDLGGLQFVSTSWPRYYAMDFLNRLPQPKRLNIVDISPSESDLPYLKNIRQLDRLVVETDFDPSATLWGLLGTIPVSWLRGQGVPGAAQLGVIQKSIGNGGHFEKLILRDGREVTSTERARLEASGLQVELRMDDGGSSRRLRSSSRTLISWE